MQQIVEKKSQCYGCGACLFECPVRAIFMEGDTEGFSYPIIDESICIDCERCKEVCPSLHKEIFDIQPSFFALRIKDQKILNQSTSGGAFSLIAEKILLQGGMICGAVYDEFFTVRHILSEDISRMRKSKYVQSTLQDVFSSLEKTLSEGRTVLFSGTPCQCHAIKRCFPDHKNLWIVSLICRGVQAPLFWKEYCRLLEKEGGRLTFYSAREKVKLDDAHTVVYRRGEEEQQINFMQDPFSRIYLKELSLRPSCYECPYTTPNKDFDFTIGDFWGVENVFPDLADGKGTSLVICGTERAEKMLQESEALADIRKCEKRDVHQPELFVPAKQSMLRRFLMKDFSLKDEKGHCDIALILKKYGG